MFISKPGFDHQYYMKNNQDAGFHEGRFKLVVDGCGSGKHSEVGAKLFSRILQDSTALFNYIEVEKVIKGVFEELTKLFNLSDYKDYLSFTFLLLREDIDCYNLYYCGDGYILSKVDDEIEIDMVGMQEDNAPPYYIYNYLPEEKLTKYKDGVSLNHHIISKIGLDCTVSKVGIATDGLRYFDEEELKKLLLKDNPVLLGAFINKNHHLFKDDITIAW